MRKIELTDMQHTTIVAALARQAIEAMDPAQVVDVLNVVAPNPIEPWADWAARLRWETSSQRADEEAESAAIKATFPGIAEEGA